MKKGIDYIGGVNFIDVIVEHHPKGYAAGFLCVASGWKNGIKAAIALAKTGNCPVMRIHGIWHDNHHFDERDIKPAVSQAKKVAKLAEKYPDIKFFYSPWLEHRASSLDFRKCKKACRKVLPKSVKLVSSGPYNKGITEVHGSSHPQSGKYIYSYDGDDMFNPKFKSSVDKTMKTHGDSIQFYGWCPRCNGHGDKNPTSGKTIPREKRTEYLRAKDIKKMAKEMGC